MHLDLELHTGLTIPQLEVLVSHHLYQILSRTQVHLESHHNNLELHILPLNKYQKVYNHLHIQEHLDYQNKILLVGQQLNQDHHKYQTYHPCPGQVLWRFQHVHEKSLLLRYTLDHLDTDHNLQVPSYHLKHLHHIRGKKHKQLVHFHPYTQGNQDCQHKKSLLEVLLQRTFFLLQTYPLHTLQD